MKYIVAATSRRRSSTARRVVVAEPTVVEGRCGSDEPVGDRRGDGDVEAVEVVGVDALDAAWSPTAQPASAHDR